MNMTAWTVSDIPPQTGRTAIVTGTGGLGYQAALALARAGSQVVIAGRNPDKGAQAVTMIKKEFAAANVRFEAIDLASLASIGAFGARLSSQLKSIDVLINNAAVMTPPKRLETTDRFELQFGTNYLGHFALTAHLLPLLRQGTEARVISLSSVAARQGVLDFDDLQSERNYKPMRAYSQSKLACLMFALEMQRRSEAGGWGVASIAAHPGVARTDLLHNAPGRFSVMGVARSMLWFLFQPAAQGALPTLFAATSPNAGPGGYYGPDRLGETRGAPVAAKVPPQANNVQAAARLWEVSAQLTGTVFA
jgi:NAD(P)-dependent dehydrogenase (short-subunit alcohol dehydrogenase family)